MHALSCCSQNEHQRSLFKANKIAEPKAFRTIHHHSEWNTGNWNFSMVEHKTNQQYEERRDDSRLSWVVQSRRSNMR